MGDDDQHAHIPLRGGFLGLFDFDPEESGLAEGQWWVNKPEKQAKAFLKKKIQVIGGGPGGPHDHSGDILRPSEVFIGGINFKFGWRLFEKPDGLYLEKTPEGKLWRISMEEVRKENGNSSD